LSPTGVYSLASGLRSATSALVCWALLLASVSTLPVHAKYDPQTSRIRVFCIGESWVPYTRYPLLLKGDPRIYYVPIPANIWESAATFQSTFGGGGENIVRKYVRMYLPRTYDQMIDSFDVAILADYEAWVIPNQLYEWIRKAVDEEGTGLAKYEINWDTGYIKGDFIQLWEATPVYAAFPSTFVTGKQVKNSNGIIPEKGNPVTDLPDISKYDLLRSGRYGIEVPRQGARVLAVFRNDPERHPAMISWRYGKGVSLSVLPGLDKIDPVALAEYPYYVDFWINQLYWAAGFPIPKDLQLVSTVRHEMLNYAQQKPLVISVIEFAQTFGASVIKLDQELSQADEIKAAADALYMEQRYADSREKLKEAYGALQSISDHAIREKDRALLWVYVIEWFAVTGTAIITGSVLYALMMKRKYYREVRVTRAQSR